MRRLTTFLWLTSAVLATSTVGCGEEPDDDSASDDDDDGDDEPAGDFPCEPGDTFSCSCGDGESGEQVCLDSGWSLGPCDCSGQGDEGPDDEGSGGGDEGTAGSDEGGSGTSDSEGSDGADSDGDDSDGDDSDGDDSGGDDFDDSSGSEDGEDSGDSSGDDSGADDATGDSGGDDTGDSGSDDGGSDGPTCEWEEPGGYTACPDDDDSLCEGDSALCLSNTDQSVSVCSRPCQDVCDCFAPPDSEAEVACVADGGTSRCVLDCSDGAECPAGMVCFANTNFGSVCVWEEG